MSWRATQPLQGKTLVVLLKRRSHAFCVLLQLSRIHGHLMLPSKTTLHLTGDVIVHTNQVSEVQERQFFQGAVRIRANGDFPNAVFGKE